jgi:hypothetical protein
MPKMLLKSRRQRRRLFGDADPIPDQPVGCWNTMSEDSHDTEIGKWI